MNASDHLNSRPILIISNVIDRPMIDSFEAQGFEVTNIQCEPNTFHRPFVLVDLPHNRVEAILATAAAHNAVLLIDEAQFLDVDRMMLLMDRETALNPFLTRHEPNQTIDDGLAKIVADMELLKASKDRANYTGFDYQTANHHCRSARSQKHSHGRRR